MDDAVSRAHREALKSAEQFRLGAALLHGRSVVASGRNRNVNSCGLHSIHAEMDAVWAYRRAATRATHKLHLVVVRVLRDGDTTACSKPCAACAKALMRQGITKVTYTTGDPSRPLATAVLV